MQSGDQLVVSVKHDVAVNVVKYFITRSTSQSFSHFWNGEVLSRLQATLRKFLGLELRRAN